MHSSSSSMSLSSTSHVAICGAIADVRVRERDRFVAQHRQCRCRCFRRVSTIVVCCFVHSRDDDYYDFRTNKKSINITKSNHNFTYDVCCSTITVQQCLHFALNSKIIIVNFITIFFFLKNNTFVPLPWCLCFDVDDDDGCNFVAFDSLLLLLLLLAVVDSRFSSRCRDFDDECFILWPDDDCALIQFFV